MKIRSVTDNAVRFFVVLFAIFTNYVIDIWGRSILSKTARSSLASKKSHSVIRTQIKICPSPLAANTVVII